MARKRKTRTDAAGDEVASLWPDVKKWIVGLVLAAGVTGLGYAADIRWLPRVNFDQYLQAQEVRDIKRDIREIEKAQLEITLRLQYEELSPERRATLEASKQQLEQQKNELERELPPQSH